MKSCRGEDLSEALIEPWGLAGDRRWMVRTLKHDNENDEAVSRLIAKVVEVGGIAHARRHMYAYRDKALEVLHHFPDADARRSLEGLLQLTVERSK